jgi:hypothetical protein
VVRALFLAIGCLASAACYRSYHPEYHPESSVSYVQNVVYTQKVVVEPPEPGLPPPIDVAMAAPYLRLWERTGKEGNERTGSPPPTNGATHGKVTSPGGVVVYGDVYGDVFVGR